MSTRGQAALNRYLDFVQRWRYLVVVAALAGPLYLASTLPSMVMTTDYRIFFAEDNPELQALDQLETTYTNADYYLLALRNDDGTMFEGEALRALLDATDKAWLTPHALRVDSVTNFQHTIAEQDDLLVADLIETADLSAEQRSAKLAVAVAEPSLVHRLISPDGQTAGVMVTIHFPPGPKHEYVPEVVAFSAQLERQLERDYPGVAVARTGLVLFDHAMLVTMEEDMAKLLPVMLGLIILLTLVLLRSLSAMVITMLLLTLAAMSAAGIGTATGIVFTSPSSMAPLMVLTLALANSVHIFVAALQHMEDGEDQNLAIRSGLKEKFEPLAVTSVTTIIGFTSLNSSGSPPMADMGNMAGFGIFVAWLLALTLLPALWFILPFREGRRRGVARDLLRSLADTVIEWRNTFLAGVGAVALGLIALVPTNDLGESFLEYFPKDLPLRKDTDYTTAHLTGPYTLEFSLSAGAEGAISEPAYLAALDSFRAWALAQDEVAHVYIFSDVQKRLNKTMHGDQQDWYRIPDSRPLAAQLLLLFEMSLPYGLDLTSQIDADKSATKVVLSLHDIHTRDIRATKVRAEGWLTANTPETMWTQGASSAVMFAYLSQRMIRNMLTGTLLAFGLIALVLMVALRDPKLGALSLVPNVFPAAVTLGIWALLVGEIGMIASVITSITMGLIVDDTVHFLSTYRRARRELGHSAADAIRHTFEHVGTALASTTVILAAGFAVLATSGFVPNQQLGTLSGITIVVALFLDFFLLPPLLLMLDGGDTPEADRLAALSSEAT